MLRVFCNSGRASAAGMVVAAALFAGASSGAGAAEKTHVIDPASPQPTAEALKPGLGVNYHFAPELVLKLALHQVEGNRLALPEDIDEAVDTGVLDDETTLVTFGAQFSF